jgi:diguanylate cyclase (GGDEF)-like protein
MTPGQPSPCADRWDRYPPPALRWCDTSRDDPITGLVSWPDFIAQFPLELVTALRDGHPVGVAIGDIDNLKDYVERENAIDPESFGHLAGNRVMSQFGTIARNWLHIQGAEAGVVATFGGDEVLIAVQLADPDLFTRAIELLRDALGEALPRTVSFGAGVVNRHHLPRGCPPTGDAWAAEFTRGVIHTIDRELYRAKWNRRATRGPGGTVTLVHLPRQIPRLIPSEA